VPKQYYTLVARLFISWGTATNLSLAVGEKVSTAAKSLSMWFYSNDIQNLVVSYKHPSSHYEGFNESSNRPT
jgi:hypothetical protein